MKKTLSVILAIAMIMSCFTGISFNVSAATTEQRLNLNTEYAFSYPSYKNVTGDNEGKNLTDGNMNTTSVFTIKNETYNYSDTSSFPGKHFNLYDEGRDPHFYVQNDFGFPSKLTKVEITFNTSSGAVLPSSVEIIISNDGYNYTIYPKQTVAKVTSGNRTTYTVTIGEDILAMGIKAYVYAPDNSMVSINEVSVIGVPNENERILLSQGKPYIWEKCKNISGYDNDSSRLLLTDGIVGKAGETTKFTGRTPDGTDEFSLSSVSELTIDLEEVKNISEVQFITMTSSPDYVVARYSEDGVNYYDLGQSYAIGRWGANGEFAEFAVMRNHTVKARYVKVLFRGKAILSEVKIYGCENAVSEMDYGFVERDDIIAHTNVAKGKSAKLASTTKSGVVDGSYNSGYADISKNTTKELIIDLSSSTANVNSVMLYFQADSSYYAPTKVETYISSNGSTYTKVESNFITHQTSDKISYQQYFDSQAVRKVKFTITASSKVARLYEAEVYAGQPQLPLIRGGFFQLQALTSNAENPDIKYTDTMWYLLVKGMKELGMDYIVLQFGAGYEGSMMFDGPRLKARGFTKGVGYGSADPYKAIFEASEKLGMKVFVGTVGGPYAGPEKITAAGGYTYINELLDIAEDAVRDIYDLYSGYKSFAGYYLADETCDKWLNQTNGVDYYRAIYKGQSDIIRQVDPTRPIMVCPAIWRNGGASAAETNLYNMLKPATTGGKPIVDIVAAQDCLGRNWSFGGDNFYVSDSVYTLYESYAQAMANATKRAGAEYWTDAEIFDCIYHTKNYSDTLDTMHLASKYSNGTIIFDVSHYFTEFSEKELANWTRLEVSHTISKYAQRYYSTYKDLNNVGRNAKALTSYNMKIQGYSYPNGTKVPSDQKISYTEKAPNMSGSIVKSEWAEFNPFVRNNNGNNAAYSMMWDEDKLYFAIDTDDTTVNAGSWGGGDAIILGFNPNSEQVIYTHGPNNINAKYQPNFYQLIFFRKANGTWALETSRCYKGNSALEISDDLITYKGVTDANGHAQFMIAIDWDLFGVSDSYIGDGMKMAYYAYYTFFDGTYESSGTSGETYKTKNLSVLLDGKKVSADPSSSGSSDFINVVAGNTPYTRNKPKMSGVIDKSIWPKFTNFYYNKNENDAAYSVMWDYDNLYIAIDTNDTTLNPGSWGSGDTVVMCLSPNEVERISTRDADPSIYTYFYQLVFFRQEDGSFLLDTARSKGGNSTLSLNNDNISYYDILDNDGHVQLVCAISWDVFGLPSGVLNDGMAFDYNFYYSFYDGASDLQYSDGSTTTYYAAIDSVLHETDFAGPQPSMNYVLNYTKKAPTKTDVIESEWPGFNEFLNGGNNSYSMMWDNDKLYIAIRTKDKVIETGKWGVPDQLGIFLDTNRTYFTYAKVADPAATPNASFMVFYGDAANNNFKWGREAHGNSVSDYANSNGSYVVNQSFDEYGRVQFVITIDYKKFLGIESLENGDKLYFGAMYGTVKANTSYKKISNSNDYIACESFELAGKEEVEPTEEVTPEEPTPEEPTPEEPTPEEVTPEVPTPEEPTPEEPTPEEPIPEEPTPEEPTPEEPTPEEPTPEEPTPEEPTPEEPTPEEPTPEEPTPEEPTPEEPTPEEPTPEEPTPEEPTPEEPTPEEPTPEEPPFVASQLKYENGELKFDKGSATTWKVGVAYIGNNTFDIAKDNWDQFLAYSNGNYVLYTDTMPKSKYGTKGNYVAFVKYKDENGNYVSTYMTFEIKGKTIVPTLKYENGELKFDKGSATTWKVGVAYIGNNTFDIEKDNWDQFLAYSNGNYVLYTDTMPKSKYGTVGNYVAFVKYKDENGNYVSTYMTFEIKGKTIVPTLKYENGELKFDKGSATTWKVGVAYIGNNTFDIVKDNWNQFLAYSNGNYVLYTDTMPKSKYGTKGNYVAFVKYKDENGNYVSTYMTFEIKGKTIVPTLKYENGELKFDKGSATTWKVGVAYIGNNTFDIAKDNWDQFLAYSNGNYVLYTDTMPKSKYGTKGNYVAFVKYKGENGNYVSTYMTFTIK